MVDGTTMGPDEVDAFVTAAGPEGQREALRDYANSWAALEKEFDSALTTEAKAGTREASDAERAGSNLTPMSIAYPGLMVAFDNARALGLLWSHDTTHFTADYALLRAMVEAVVRAAWVTIPASQDERLNRTFRVIAGEFAEAVRSASQELEHGNPGFTTAQLRQTKRDLLRSRDDVATHFRDLQTTGWRDQWKGETIGIRTMSRDLADDIGDELGYDALTLIRSWSQLSGLSHGATYAVQGAALRSEEQGDGNFGLQPNPKRVFVYAITVGQLLEATQRACMRQISEVAE